LVSFSLRWTPPISSISFGGILVVRDLWGDHVSLGCESPARRWTTYFFGLLWVTVCRTECLSLRVEGCDGVWQVLVDENVEEVVGCCWEEGEQDLGGGRLSICSPQAAANRPKQPTAEILSPQSCEFTLVRDKVLGMGGSF
jgi:hypothetical protein